MSITITVKKLQGEELILMVSESCPILEIKKQVHIQLKIPIYRQKLIFQGKLLADDNSLNDYKLIKDGSKINLMVKEPESLYNALKKLLAKYFSPEQAEKYAKDVSADLERKMENMSLDDVARIIQFYKDEDEKMSECL